jgi:hypothetical protein
MGRVSFRGVLGNGFRTGYTGIGWIIQGLAYDEKLRLMSTLPKDA